MTHKKIILLEWQTVKVEAEGRGLFSKFYHLKRTDGSLWYAIKSDEYDKTLHRILSVLEEIQKGLDNIPTSSGRTGSPTLSSLSQGQNFAVFCTKCGMKDVESGHNYCGRCGEKLRSW